MPIDNTNANLSMHTTSMDGPSSSTADIINRQKRTVPSRSRRGGPVLGNCEVDNLILETKRRKLENEPLIPADTPFLLTTDPKYAVETADGSDLGIKINIVANERYFDRPDVLKAFREQTVIQTPEYEAISDSVSGVGGRFRPRNLEEALAGTSDAAYEKRHRKFENFEKRQRLREKEKLKHEHYKLKERIEQLKGMDGSAFMTLPASVFSPAPRQDGAEELASPYPAIHGGIPHAEGERRRREMLGIAIKLERRYAYLLPSERLRKAQEGSTSTLPTKNDDDSEGEQDSGTSPSKTNNAARQRIQSVRSSDSSTLVPSPRTVTSRKSRPYATVPYQHQHSSTRNLRSSSLTYTAPIQPVPENQSPTQHLINDNDPEIPELQGTIPPPTAPEFEERLFTPPPSTVDDILSPNQEPHPPPTRDDGMHQADVCYVNGDVSMENVLDKTQPANEVADRDPPQQQPPLFNSVDKHIVDDGESEIAVLEARDVEQEEEPQLLQPPPKKKGRKPKTVAGPAEAGDGEQEREPRLLEPPQKKKGRKPKMVVVPVGAVSTVLQAGMEPAAAVTPEQPAKKRRGRKPRWLILQEQEAAAAANAAADAAAGTEASPVPRELRFKFHQASFTGPSSAVDVQGEQHGSVSGREEAPTQLEVISISTRPKKRPRVRKEGMDGPVSAPTRNLSARPAEKGTSISAAVTSVRGKTYVSYTDSRTGETVRTASLLMIASVRAVEKTNVRKARDTCSFGVQTPEFVKMTPVDYELQEDILYRNFKDKTPSAFESGVEPLGVEEDRLERVEKGTDRQDNDGNAGEGHTTDVGEAMNTDERNDATDEWPPQLSDPPRNEGLGTQQGDPKLMNRARLLRLSQLFDDEPPIVASPDPEPSTDLVPEGMSYSGVRPREPSVHVDGDEELPW